MPTKALATFIALLAATGVSPAIASSLVGQLPACTGSIDIHLDIGCRMRATWHGGTAAGEPGSVRAVVSSQVSAVVRALAPVGTNLLESRLTYIVHFKAADGASDRPLDDTFRVRVWLGDDRNETTVAVRDVKLSVGSSTAVPVTLEATGVPIPFQPHFVYASFTQVGSLDSKHDSVDRGTVTIEGVEMGIRPLGP
jgi:hypothetical protein